VFATASLSRWIVPALTALSVGCGSGDPILIGLAGPFSQARGASMRLAAQLAVDEINRTGGIDGRDLTLVVGDDSASADAAVRLAQQFQADSRIVAVIGHLTSGTTLAAAPIYNGSDDPLLEISPSASNPAVSDAGPYTFRVCPSDLRHGDALATWARSRLRAQTAAILYQDDEYGRGVRGTFASSFTSQGGTVISEDPFVLGLPGFEPFLQRIRADGGADLLLVAGTEAAAERMLPTLDSVGLRTTVMGGDGLAGIQSSGVEADGVLISTAYLADRPGDRNAVFVAAYRAAYDNQVPDHRGAGAYDIVQLLAQALRAVGPDRQRLRDYVAGIGTSTPPFEGVTGRIAFDGNGDVPDKEVVIGQVVGRTLVTARNR